jgi:intracellular sulfur oxidation DsrE/DsrF family protein
MKYILFILSLSLTSLNLNSQTTVKHKIVMQLTSSDTLVHKGLLKQLNNLHEGWGDSVEIEVVCHGPGIEFLMKGNTQNMNKINNLKDKKIRFVACENTLKEKKIDKNKLMPNLEYVLMGIAEIVEKQEQGWSYIKAGF